MQFTSLNMSVIKSVHTSLHRCRSEQMSIPKCKIFLYKYPSILCLPLVLSRSLSRETSISPMQNVFLQKCSMSLHEYHICLMQMQNIFIKVQNTAGLVWVLRAFFTCFLDQNNFSSLFFLFLSSFSVFIFCCFTL